MSRRRTARPEPQERTTLVEKRSGLAQSVHLNPPGRDFDRQRHAVKPPADVHHDRGVGFAEVQAGTARRRAFEEKLGSPGTSKRRPR